LVKGPSNYDPFLGGAERRARATERAHDRTRYVLRRLAEESPERLRGPFEATEVAAVQSEARRLLDEDFSLPFERGSFRYDRSVVVDEVVRRLGAPPFDTLLADAGVEHIETSGLVVRTTLQEAAQREAVYGLRHHLTEAGIGLEGLDVDKLVIQGGSTLRYDPTRVIGPHSFFHARVTGRDDSGVEVDLGGTPCLLDEEAIGRLATAIARGRTKRTSTRSTASDRDAVRAALADGAVVLVSVRDAPTEERFAR
ncbi:MAG: hypothetical protein GY884_21440, partial [Proteobacteria bacterium]|nr:hypothetical protein [Pseudomonadota bacterium]